MWIRSKRALLNLDNLVSVYLHEMYGGKEGEVVGVALNGHEICIYKGPLDKANHMLLEVTEALRVAGKLYFLPLPIRNQTRPEG